MKVVGTMAIILVCMVTWEIVLTNMCGGSSVDIGECVMGTVWDLILQLIGHLGVVVTD